MGSSATVVGLVVVSFVAMEPVTYLLHRFVMHGRGMAWHASHHRTRHGRFERNDLYPVVMASSTIAVMLVGVLVAPLWFLVPVGVGVTLYGMSYLFVHDLYTHRRFVRLRRRLPVLQRLADDHALHHRFGGEPYGMLVPVVPARLRARAAERPPRPLAR